AIAVPAAVAIAVPAAVAIAVPAAVAIAVPAAVAIALPAAVAIALSSAGAIAVVANTVLTLIIRSLRVALTYNAGTQQARLSDHVRYSWFACRTCNFHTLVRRHLRTLAGAYV
ncbi:MAG: hypothetical protein ACK4Z3_08630, partial [Rhizobium rosettiformans]